MHLFKFFRCKQKTNLWTHSNIRFAKCPHTIFYSIRCLLSRGEILTLFCLDMWNIYFFKPKISSKENMLLRIERKNLFVNINDFSFLKKKLNRRINAEKFNICLWVMESLVGKFVFKLNVQSRTHWMLSDVSVKSKNF